MGSVLHFSYGKDSFACLGAIKHLGWPLDGVYTADLYAAPGQLAYLPDVVDFRQYADRWIKQNYGITVQHFHAKKVDGVSGDPVTFQDLFLRKLSKGNRAGQTLGWPLIKNSYCIKLKSAAIGEIRSASSSDTVYLGIASDESERITRWSGRAKLPLVELGWTEEYCGLWCQLQGVLSPSYSRSFRDGCFFCHKQSIDQLRYLRSNHLDLWRLMLFWDARSPVSFLPNGIFLFDLDKRFYLEDIGVLIPGDKCFRYSMLDSDIQLKFF